MNSKKRHIRRSRPWRSAQTSSDRETALLANRLAAGIAPGEWVLLEGPMGAGKTVFANALLQAFGVGQPPGGSPSFPIVHEYDSITGGIAHIDFFRLKNANDADAVGIPSYFWEREITVVSEWTSTNQELFERLLLPRRKEKTWLVRIDFDGSGGLKRIIEINVIFPASSR